MTSLPSLRKKVELIDHKILLLISKRQQLAPKFAKLKQQLHLPLHQPKREQELLKKYQQQTKQLNLSQKITRQIFKLLIKSSLNTQQKFINNPPHLKKIK